MIVYFYFFNWISERYTVFPDVFQIMPNHIHGIITLDVPVVGATLAVAQSTNAQQTGLIDGATANVINRATARVASTVVAGNDVNVPVLCPTHTQKSPIINVPTIDNIIETYKSLVFKKTKERKWFNIIALIAVNFCFKDL